MLFATSQYAVFFAVVFCIYWLTPRSWRWVFLLLASYFLRLCYPAVSATHPRAHDLQLCPRPGDRSRVGTMARRAAGLRHRWQSGLHRVLQVYWPDPQYTWAGAVSRAPLAPGSLRPAPDQYSVADWYLLLRLRVHPLHRRSVSRAKSDTKSTQTGAVRRLLPYADRRAN